MNRKFITVLLSVYNGENYLKSAIESILNQSFKDFEFIIIDDRSRDNSWRVINSFKDPRITPVKNEKNIGLAKSLNKGIGMAKGKYIVRMDADDISFKNRIKTLIGYMEENDEIGVCGSWVKTFGEFGGEVWKYPKHDTEIKSHLIFKSPFAHPSVIIRKNVLLDNNIFYDTTLKASQDYALWVSLSELTKFANLEKVLLQYRLHPANTGRVSNEQKKNAGKIRLKQLHKLSIMPSQRDLVLHNKLGDWELDHDENFLDNSESWLLKLIQANVEAKYLPERQFINYLSSFWLQICRYVAPLGLKSWKKFWGSPLSTKVKLEGRLGLFLMECLIKKNVKIRKFTSSFNNRMYI